MLPSSPDRLRALLATKAALLADVDPDPGAPERLLIRSDLTGTMQLYELTVPGALHQVTALPEPVGAARYLPGGRQAVVEVDSGGNERHQLYLVDLETPDDGAARGFDVFRPITSDARYGHHLAGVDPRGRLIAYLSNKANGVDFDLWLYDVPGDEHRLAFAGGGWCQPASGFSPDGRWVSILRPGTPPLDVELLLVEVDTCEVRRILAHPDEPALVGAPAWAGPTTFYVSSNVGRDMATVLRCSETGVEAVEGAGGDWDAEPVTSAGGAVLAIVENCDGASRIGLLDQSDGPGRTEVPLPEAGVVTSHAIALPQFSRGGSHLYYTFSSPRQAGDVWAFDRATGETRRLTTSPAPVDPARLARAETTRLDSFDGEHVPLFVFRPPENCTERSPVVVLVHGGPESQAVLSFNPVIQGLVDAGFAVAVPNVRGSTGYGKRYAALDDTTRRLDSVRDLEAVHRWLAGAGFDADRIALWGGSYGGYMVLAGLAFQPHLWAAGVDIVGISDLVTFLENTSDYRRQHREREYGWLSRDREFLAAASPLRHADAIRAPLFVIHGRNDPRVPVSEAEQLVASLSGRGVRCELAIYEDEGHGLARLTNRLDAYPRAIAFLDEVLGA